MRELKFRIWDLKYNEMLPKSDDYGQYLLSLHGKCFLTTGVFQTKKYAFDECVLMQYTGMKDKNGKEIYEGDIVEIRILNKDDNPDAKIAPDWETVEKYEVYWNTHDCCFMMRNNKTNHRKMPKFIIENVTVVGNIFENKDLLE